jgi:hypothetical protein
MILQTIEDPKKISWKNISTQIQGLEKKEFCSK